MSVSVPMPVLVGSILSGTGTGMKHRRRSKMAHLKIHRESSCDDAPCVECGQPLSSAEGPRLVMEANSAAVCRDCGRKHAPSLAALLDLARAAQRVGDVGRHTLVLPMAALLDLARAAENYTHSAQEQRRRAA